jgi:hypothetical protein
MECESRTEINQRYEDSRRELQQANHSQDLPATAQRAMLERRSERQFQSVILSDPERSERGVEGPASRPSVGQ